MASLADRVTQLVEDFHGGNLSAAARDTGVLQSTLHRVASGSSPNPTDEVVAAIADFYGVTAAWLRTGRGRSPKKQDSQWMAEVRRWFKQLARLDLPAGVHAILEDLPFATSKARAELVPSHLAKHQGFEEAERLELSAWTQWLEAFIDAAGVYAVREALSDRTKRHVLLLGASRWAVDLYTEGAIDPDKMRKLDIAYAERGTSRRPLYAKAR